MHNRNRTDRLFFSSSNYFNEIRNGTGPGGNEIDSFAVRDSDETVSPLAHCLMSFRIEVLVRVVAAEM